MFAWCLYDGSIEFVRFAYALWVALAYVFHAILYDSLIVHFPWNRRMTFVWLRLIFKCCSLCVVRLIVYVFVRMMCVFSCVISMLQAHFVCEIVVWLPYDSRAMFYMMFVWICDVHTMFVLMHMNFIWFFAWFVYDYPAMFLCVSYDCHTIVLRLSCVCLLRVIRSDDGLHMLII